MNLSLQLRMCALLLLSLAGCTHMPTDVAAELSPPDGERPNNFASTATQAPVDTPATDQ